MNQEFSFLKFKNDFENLFIFRERNSSEISAFRKHLIQFIKKLELDFNYFLSSEKILIVNFDIHQIEIESSQIWNIKFENQLRFKSEIESIENSILTSWQFQLKKSFSDSHLKSRKTIHQSKNVRWDFDLNIGEIRSLYQNHTKKRSKNRNQMKTKNINSIKKKQIQKLWQAKLRQTKKSKQNWIFSSIQFYWISN